MLSKAADAEEAPTCRQAIHLEGRLGGAGTDQSEDGAAGTGHARLAAQRRECGKSIEDHGLNGGCSLLQVVAAGKLGPTVPEEVGKDTYSL